MECSFCGISDAELARSPKFEFLIIGPEINICSKCVNECQHIIAERTVSDAVDKIRRAVWAEYWQGA